MLPDAPAQKAGLQQHDILLTVDGKPLQRSEGLSAAVKASAGKALKFSLVRGGQRIELTVTPEKRPSDREALVRWVQPPKGLTLLWPGEKLATVRSVRLPPAAGDTPALTGPDVPSWRRTWALDESRRRRAERRWPR